MIIIGLFLLLPVIVTLFYNEYSYIPSFLIPAFGIFIISSVILPFLKKDELESFSSRDGILFVNLAWLLAGLIGSLPFLISKSIPSFTDAFFETMSGFTTTGASILTDIEKLPKSILFWRALTHWLGGMGIVVLTIAVLPFIGSGGMQLIRPEVAGPSMEKAGNRIAQTAKNLWIIYLVLTILETFLLMFFKLDLFEALTHSFATMATGGFSIWNKSVGYYNSAGVQITITIFMILAASNYIFFYNLFTGRFKEAIKNEELKFYLIIVSFSILLCGFTLWIGGGRTLSNSFRNAAFHCASILTTTGFVVEDYTSWPFVSQIIIFLLMFIGGCSSSTGGGIKVIRILVLAKLALHEINYRLHPRAVFSLNISGRRTDKSFIYPIAAFFFVYIFFVLFITLCVSSGGYDLTTSLSTALATLGNIGPGFGKVSPAGNYAFFPDRIKWVLSFAMMAGRLELYTFIIIFTKRFWKD